MMVWARRDSKKHPGFEILEPMKLLLMEECFLCAHHKIYIILHIFKAILQIFVLSVLAGIQQAHGKKDRFTIIWE